MDFSIDGLNRLSGNALEAQFSMRYRLASDPDVDASYTAVTENRNTLGVTYPFFDVFAVPAGIYVVHTYYTPDGPTTGTKITVETSGGALT